MSRLKLLLIHFVVRTAQLEMDDIYIYICIRDVCNQALLSAKHCKAVRLNFQRIVVENGFHTKKTSEFAAFQVQRDHSLDAFQFSLISGSNCISILTFVQVYVRTSGSQKCVLCQPNLALASLILTSST